MTFGVMAILERRPRSAVVRADTPFNCRHLAIADFEHRTSTHRGLEGKLPGNFARSLSMRVRQRTGEIRTLSEQGRSVPGPPPAPTLFLAIGSGKEGGMRLATKLAPIVLQEAGGHDVRLGSLWHERPVVLAFIRHFG